MFHKCKCETKKYIEQSELDNLWKSIEMLNNKVEGILKVEGLIVEPCLCRGRDSYNLMYGCSQFVIKRGDFKPGNIKPEHE